VRLFRTVLKDGQYERLLRWTDYDYCSAEVQVVVVAASCQNRRCNRTAGSQQERRERATAQVTKGVGPGEPSASRSRLSSTGSVLSPGRDLMRAAASAEFNAARLCRNNRVTALDIDSERCRLRHIRNSTTVFGCYRSSNSRRGRNSDTACIK